MHSSNLIAGFINDQCFQKKLIIYYISYIEIATKKDKLQINTYSWVRPALLSHTQIFKLPRTVFGLSEG